MIHYIFALRDGKLQAFMPPFFAQTEAVACRMVADVVNGEKNNNVASHPEDFELFVIGTFSDADGTVVPMAPRPVVQCSNLVR